MVQWVYERARAARRVSCVVVATDDARVERAVRAFGGDVVMTDPGLASGTDRVAAVAEVREAAIYVNVQGDEPLLDPAAIDRAVELVAAGKFRMATAMTPLRSADELTNPAVVKVIADRSGRAIYFSRHPIPYSRQSGPPAGEPYVCRRHVGLYVFDRATLRELRSLPPCALERAESLEQLRALEAGIAIGCAEADFVSIGVDTPEELEKARAALVLEMKGSRHG